MIDTYVAESEDELRVVLSTVLAPLLERRDDLLEIADTGLLTMASYFRALTEWEPERHQVPSLLIRASQSLAHVVGKSDVAPWQEPTQLEHVDSDHFTIMSDAADGTARMTETWLESLGVSVPAAGASDVP